jgi:ribonuclease HI
VLRYGSTERVLTGSDPDTTNNRMELTAAIAALKALDRPCRVELHTDSRYLQQGITKWLPNWVARGWRKADRRPVLNDDLWKQLHRLIQEHEVEWHWVRSHVGDLQNERVDALAFAAIPHRGDRKRSAGRIERDD